MRYNKLNFILPVFILLGGFLNAAAQTETPDTPTENSPKRPSLLAQLNLSREQIQNIREINQRNRPQIREANQRLRMANRDLDAAVYSDAANETDVQTKIQEVRDAHAEAVKLRAETEYAVRKILTPEQLSKFREIRERSMIEKQMMPRLRDNRRINNRRNIQNRMRNNRP